ncbi:U20-lycotoxin-Ls1c, partial [Stegodyphus mimosarum]
MLVACIVVITAEKYCPEIKNTHCELSYRINDCCSQSDCRSYAICCKGRCGNVCRMAKDAPTNGVAVKDGEECKLGHVYPKTGLEWLFGEKSR